MQRTKSSCWIEELPEDGEGNGLEQLTAFGSLAQTPAGGPDPLPCVPAFGSPAGGAAATPAGSLANVTLMDGPQAASGFESPSAIHFRHTAFGTLLSQS